jgi:hypothetical protein
MSRHQLEQLGCAFHMLGGDDLGDAQIHLAKIVDGDERLELAGLSRFGLAAWAGAGLALRMRPSSSLLSAAGWTSVVAGARESRLASSRASICLRSMRVIRWL